MSARRLADSLLSVHEPRSQAEAKMLVSLAALTGRGRLAAGYARLAEGPSTPLPVATIAPALEIYAAMGGPVDSVHRLERQLEGAMGRLLGAEVGVVRSNWLIRSASLAIPVHHFEHLPIGAGNASSRLRLVEAWNARDLARARNVLDDVRLQRQRALVRPFDIAIDGLYSEAATMMVLGDRRGALEWVSPTLDSLAFATAASLSTGARAATLVRAMALRADGEESIGDRRMAAAWARSAMILWSNADASYQPLVDRMRRMSPAAP